MVEKDEFHPDPREAAKHADANARSYTLNMLQARLKRLLENDNPLSYGQSQMVEHIRAELVIVRAAIKEAEDAAAV